jgi:TPP-dependent trihydroxycyclohexane-1,2-dione (THcHDO) dehydratase
MIAALDSASWWDVLVAKVARRDVTQSALKRYEAERTIQRKYFRPTT